MDFWLTLYNAYFGVHFPLALLTCCNQFPTPAPIPCPTLIPHHCHHTPPTATATIPHLFSTTTFTKTHHQNRLLHPPFLFIPLHSPTPPNPSLHSTTHSTTTTATPAKPLTSMPTNTGIFFILYTNKSNKNLKKNYHTTKSPLIIIGFCKKFYSLHYLVNSCTCLKHTTIMHN